MLCKQRGRLSRHQNCFSQVFSSQAQSLFLQIAWNAALSLTILCRWRPGLRLGGPAVWPRWKYLKPKPKYYRPYANASAQGIAERSPVWWRSSCMRSHFLLGYRMGGFWAPPVPERFQWGRIVTLKNIREVPICLLQMCKQETFHFFYHYSFIPWFIQMPLDKIQWKRRE